MNTKKVNQTRRQRGYAFETSLVSKFKGTPGWDARRLGSPSTNLPDVFARNNDTEIVVAIEAKSGTTNLLYVPDDQIQRCMDWVNMFSIYEEKCVVLAFKFSQKKRITSVLYKHRPLKLYYKIWPLDMIPCKMSCDYEGNNSTYRNEIRESIDLEDFKFDQNEERK